MEVNLRAPLVLIQALDRQLPEGYRGHVINMIDERVLSLTPYFVTYTLSEFGLWGLTQTMALALAPRIEVNGIGPGPTMQGARQTDEHFDRRTARYRWRTGPSRTRSPMPCSTCCRRRRSPGRCSPSTAASISAGRTPGRS